MTVAALVVAIVSALVAAQGVYFAWRSVKSARGSELAAKEAAEAVKKQAAIEAAQLEIEKHRVHQEMTPVLVGIIKGRPIPGRPGLITYQLEIHIKTPRAMVQVTLQLPDGTWVGDSRISLGIRHDLFYPEPGNLPAIIEPGRPASWSVEVAKPTLDTIIGIASCRNETGEIWNGIEVPITMDGSGVDLKIADQGRIFTGERRALFSMLATSLDEGPSVRPDRAAKLRQGWMSIPA